MSEENSSSLFRMASDCGCSDGSCEPDVSRRDFLKITGLASAAVLFGQTMCCGDEASAASNVKLSPHLIPADKNLPAGWLRSLYEQGERTWYKGEELRTIGMPVGGIGTGQLFLCGDGTLGQWEIFNEFEFLGWGERNYARRTIPKRVKHGLALIIELEGKKTAWPLDETGFSNVRFRGEYPIGTVTYEDPDCPVKVTLEGFSPFIPLNAPDSALPLTYLVLALENTGDSSVAVQVVSWLENPIARTAVPREWNGTRHNLISRSDSETRIEMSATGDGKEDDEPTRKPIVFATFEHGYGYWKTSGTALGDKPSTGTFGRQGAVSGFQDQHLVNTFYPDDGTRGKLTSPRFTIHRNHINFMIGGGDKPGVGMRLMVDNKEVRRAAGKTSEKLDWSTWNVTEFVGKEAYLEIFDDVTDGWGHILIDQIEFSDRPRFADGIESFDKLTDSGTMTWLYLGESVPADAAIEQGKVLPGELSRLIKWDDQQEGDLEKQLVAGMITAPLLLSSFQKATARFALTWHFPNTLRPNKTCGHEYAARFKDANAVADYAVKNFDRLYADTRKWRDTWYDSTLPYWLLDRLFWTTTCLATGTAQWWEDGRFWAWEGVVCCAGTCTHVWNYAQSLARLFPELERNVRERQDLGVGLLENGLVGFRHDGAYAADGQCGTVLKVWREHLMSADQEFLIRNWEKVKNVLGYSMEQDQNGDGVIENRQHNTYDIDFYGANTFVGALYLAALRAGEEMAKEMGDTEFASRCRKIYESGRHFTEEKLWNEEYFIQQVDLEKHPVHQYGDGCLSDQLFGQTWAHQVSLGYLYSPDKVRKSMESVWKYNWAPDVGLYNKVFPAGRPFAQPEEAGLFLCTWPRSQHPENGVMYRDEVWTGIEYQVAANMIYEGLVEEGLAICRAIHDRYHPAKRNPYNEIECSDFYARAMASWGVLQALSGYEYHGPQGRLAFAPRFRPANFRSAFTTAEGWGTFEQQLRAEGSEWRVAVAHGSLRLKQLELDSSTAGNLRVFLDEVPVASNITIVNNRLVITFREEVRLQEGQALLVHA